MLLTTTATIGPRTIRRVSPDWDDRPYELFSLEPLAVTIGAHIDGVDIAQRIDDPLFAELNRALLEWKVLFFRDQSVNAEQHVDFARRWGPLEIHPSLASGELPELVRFEKGGDVRDQAHAGYENLWHTDVTFRECPSLGSVLHCLVAPAMGGDTLFADMYAAYDNLPAELAQRIDALHGVHSYIRTFGRALPPDERAAMEAKLPDQHHPVVRTHPETGRKLLFVNGAFCMEIDGLAPDESAALLDQLCRYAMMPEIQCRWRWRAGDVAFWDNRATQHYACSDYWPQTRIMERATIVGDRPY
jgi:taurine dioxygenase